MRAKGPPPKTKGKPNPTLAAAISKAAAATGKQSSSRKGPKPGR